MGAPHFTRGQRANCSLVMLQLTMGNQFPCSNALLLFCFVYTVRLWLVQVWEQVDELPEEDFDPKTFFHLHDVNGDGFWDDAEVEALFQKELDKMYNETDPDDDMNERWVPLAFLLPSANN